LHLRAFFEVDSLLQTQRENAMTLILPPETYRRLEKRFGEEETKDLVKALEEALQAFGEKNDDAIERIENKAGALITQKKFELKDELTKELATKADILEFKGGVKADIERLEGMIKNAELKLDRKFTIMFLILLFTTIFVNQNALRFIAEMFGLIKP
jgi:hypothetical protein